MLARIAAFGWKYSGLALASGSGGEADHRVLKVARLQGVLILPGANRITGIGHIYPFMPSLIRLLVVLCVIAGAVYGGMIALVMLVEPTPREMTIRVPTERLEP